MDGSLFYLQSGSGAQRPTSERRSSLLCSSAQVMLQALVNSSSLPALEILYAAGIAGKVQRLGVACPRSSIQRIKLYGRFVHADIHIVFVLEAVLQHLELQYAHHADDDLLHAAAQLLEDLDGALLGDLCAYP